MNFALNLARMGRLCLVASCLACASDSGASGDDQSADPCVPGTLKSCECDDGTPGTQLCEPDGVGYDACVCQGDDDGSTGDDPSATGASASGSPTSDPSGDPSGDPTDASATADGGTAPGDTGDTGDTIPLFEPDIVPILYQSCGANNVSCHARNAYFPNSDQGCRGWLSLEDEPLGSSFDDLDPDTQMPSEGPVPGCNDRSLHQRLMELAPWECGTDARYIVPGAPEQSYIFEKLTNGTVCGDFRVMPPPNEGYAISAEQQATLEAWILAGALP